MIFQLRCNAEHCKRDKKQKPWLTGLFIMTIHSELQQQMHAQHRNIVTTIISNWHPPSSYIAPAATPNGL